MSDQHFTETTSPSTTSAPTPTPTSARTSSTLSIISFVLSAIAVFIVPIIFGLAAIICGGVAVARKERLGPVALGVSVVATILGFVLGYIVWSNR
jgi:hypothetical protein